MAIPIEAWDYRVVATFKYHYYRDLLLKSHLYGFRTSVKPNGPDSDPLFVYTMAKDKIKYAIPEDVKNKLPILVTNSKKLGGKDSYILVTGYKSARFTPLKNHSFRELIDEFLPFNHTNQQHFTLWKLIIFASYYGRVNIRVATTAGFGKDSPIGVMKDLFGDVAAVTHPSLPKICKLLVGNKIILINEVADLKPETLRDIGSFFLEAAAFKSDFEKPTRATDDVPENFDISNTSILVCYNTKDHYTEGTKYFDNMFHQQILERLVPFKFNGKITHEFYNINTPKLISDMYKDEFVKFIKSVEYYKQHWNENVKSYGIKAKDLGFTDRYARSVDAVIDMISLYANDENEFRELLYSLKEAHDDYNRMVNPHADFEMFNIVKEERVI
jgi:hypothetical protein